MTELAVLHFVSSVSGGGAEHQCVRLMRELRKRGHRIGVGYLYDGPKRPNITGIEEFRIDGRGNYDPRILVRLIRAIQQFRPHLVQSWILQMDVWDGCKGYGCALDSTRAKLRDCVFVELETEPAFMDGPLRERNCFELEGRRRVLGIQIPRCVQIGHP
jgi:hypothetical protein